MTERVNIFISYKRGDVALANAVDRIFGDFGGDRVETFVATKMLPGTLWENWIRDSLAQSHLLFLLFTDPDQDWGWCLFEAGLFLGLDVGDHRHVICLYQPKNEPPRPLKSIQGVPANTSDILSMLKTVFRETTLTQTSTPLSKNVSDDALHAAAENISKLFLLRMAKPEPVYPELLFTFTEPMLSNDTVVTPNTRALSLFGIGEGEWKWGKFIDELNLRESPLVDELGRVMQLIARRRAPGPVAANYRSIDTGIYYTPAIYNVERLDEKLVTCRAAFVPQSTPIEAGGPGNAGVLFSLLKMGVRFRWEIVETFLSKFRAADQEPAANTYLYLKNAMDVIEREGAAFHYDEYENIKVLFAPSRQDQILSLYNQWRPLRVSLGEKIEAKDAKGIIDALEKIRGVNQKFMAITSIQYAEDLA
jgi:hypothetical protein